MPTYDYQCRSCGAITEVIHSMLAEGPRSCERCGGDLRRVLYPAGIIFKGPGFYRTDSRSSGKSASSSEPSSKPASDSGSNSSTPKDAGTASGGTTKAATGGDAGD